MRILILHRIPYQKIEYHRAVDHDVHEVTYFGKREALDTLPASLRCATFERPGVASAFEEARVWLTREPKRFDRIISLSEYELLDAARLREWLGVPGPALEQVRLARDKTLMKTAVTEAGLSAPRFLLLPDFLSSGGRAAWQGATVLKPHSGASSEEVVVFPSVADAYTAIKAHRSGVPGLDSGHRDAAQYELEEFVTGAILHFDGLVQDGHVLTMTASEYVGDCLRFANGEPLGSFHIPFDDTARAWVSSALSATGICNGSFHLEAIRRRDELVFLEVGNRVGGADVVRTFELATGIHLPSQELRILLGEGGDFCSCEKSRTKWHGWFVYPGHHLRNAANFGVAGAAAFSRSPYVVHWHELPFGATLPRNITYQAHETPLAGVIATDCASHTRDWIEVSGPSSTSGSERQ
ncbi:acetyl-CoA carboxylase biotin carboxylase subunit family protein [Caballeronia sp. Sq4a]|uniref:ATP-grasp domain-containing protein n=1 Tax=Caballeronia sp. Sq4a TaxID=2878152 RepID=UPI0020C0C48C|nr:ATP-grasp domain-containing protein [Caballeronia sp. Sq4a]